MPWGIHLSRGLTMADTAAANGAGAPTDAPDAMLHGAIEGMRHAPLNPAATPRVAAAFALGWEMGELYRPGSTNSATQGLGSHLPD